MCRPLISLAFVILLLAGCDLSLTPDTPHGVYAVGSLAVQGSLTYTPPRDADAGVGDAGTYAPQGFTADLSDPSANVIYDAASGSLSFASGWVSVSLGSRPRVGTRSLSELNASVCVGELACQPAYGSLDVRAYDVTCGTAYKVVCDDTVEVCAGTIDVTFTLASTSRGGLWGTVHLAGTTTLARDPSGCAG